MYDGKVDWRVAIEKLKRRVHKKECIELASDMTSQEANFRDLEGMKLAKGTGRRGVIILTTLASCDELNWKNVL